MKRSGFTLIEFVVVVGIILILAAILLPVFNRPRPGGGSRSICQSNLKQIALGFKQYIQDYDEKFPPVAVAPSGYWVGSLQPYVKSWQIFQCPSAEKHAPKTTDYFYNAHLAGVAEKNLDFESQTILMGDGSDDSPLSYALSDLPENWRIAEKAPAKRHLDGANYAFADGHVKWLKLEKISSATPRKGVWTFALK